VARRSMLDLMRRRRPEGELLDSRGRTITASAAVIPLTDRSEGVRLAEKALRQPWQDEAWTYRRNIGEVRYVQDWLGVAVSRMRLFVGVITDQADEPIPIDDALAPPVGSGMDPVVLPAGLVQAAKDALAALGDTASLLHRATVSTESVGEFYLVGYVDAFQRERWEVRNIREMVETDWGWQLKGSPQSGRNQSSRPAYTHEGGNLLDPADSYFARIWRADAEWSDLADSPMSAVRGHCELLLLLERKARGNARSRLSAPLLLIPKDQNPRPVIGPNGPVPVTPTSQLVMDHVITPIGDESAASAVAPIVIETPSPQDWTTLDVGRNSGPEDRAEREEALERILQGIDADTEIVEGMSGVKFANQKAITQDRFRYLIEPKVMFQVHGLTTAYLHTRLAADGWDPALIERLCLWYDPSALVSNPDQGKDALLVHEAGELSGKALRAATGFGEEDAPTDEERAMWLATRTRPANQQQIPAADAGQSDGGATAVAQVRQLAQRRYGATYEQIASSIVASATTQQASDLGARLLRIDLATFQKLQGACDAAMARAMERAGGRVRSKAQAAGENISGTSNDRLVSVLGADGIQRLGVTETDLLAGDPFADVCARFETWAEAALEQGLRAYAKALGLTYHPPSPVLAQGSLVAAATPPPFSDLGGLDFPVLRAQGHRDIQSASAKLRAELTRVAAARLFDPGFTDTAGEHDPTTTVPPGTIRAALARAGGADSHPRSGGVDDNGRAVSDLDPQPGGVASGWTLREAASDAGLKPYAYTWSHGASPNPFEPHLALDGQTFHAQTDSRLAKSPTDWPKGTTSYYPGDHPGCTCMTQYDYPDPFAGLSRSEAARVRAAQQARDEHGRFAGRRDHPDDTPGEGTTPRPRT
jgi:hypothetical protein